MKLSDYPTLAEAQAEIERRAVKLLQKAQMGHTHLNGCGKVAAGTDFNEACLLAIDYEEEVALLVGRA